MPAVSVLMASHNHAAFVGEAMRSILAQTHRDLELIVVDDGSTDGTNAAIRAIVDPRVTHIPLDENVGAAEASRIALARSTGPLVAICNSDDVWEPSKLQRQLAVLEAMPEVAAVFSWASAINARGTRLGVRASAPTAIFDQPNRSRFAWMKRLIESGNCLCHPSVVVRRSVYDALGSYNNHLRQLPDYDMWLRLLQRHDIHVLPERLVRFRLHRGNTSKATRVNSARNLREAGFILTRYFADLSEENFVRTFRPLDPPPLPLGERGFVREKALYLIGREEGPLGDILRRIGLQLAFDLSCTPGLQAVPALEFQAMTGAVHARLHGVVRWVRWHGGHARVRLGLGRRRSGA